MFVHAPILILTHDRHMMYDKVDKQATQDNYKYSVSQKAT